MFPNEIISKLVTWAAIGGALLSVGIGIGINLSNRDHTKRMAQLEGKRQAEAEVVDKIVTEYVEKIVTREVPVYVPSPDSCPELDGAFRLFFDDAATVERLSKATRHTDAAPVPVKDVAATTADNFRICHDTADRLEALQAWAKEVTK